MKAKFIRAAKKLIEGDIAPHFRRRGEAGGWPLDVAVYAEMALAAAIEFNADVEFKKLLRKNGYEVEWDAQNLRYCFTKAKKTRKRAKP